MRKEGASHQQNLITESQVVAAVMIDDGIRMLPKTLDDRMSATLAGEHAANPGQTTTSSSGLSRVPQTRRSNRRSAARPRYGIPTDSIKIPMHNQRRKPASGNCARPWMSCAIQPSGPFTMQSTSRWRTLLAV